jgi:hypothetical protein
MRTRSAAFGLGVGALVLTGGAAVAVAGALPHRDHEVPDAVVAALSGEPRCESSGSTTYDVDSEYLMGPSSPRTPEAAITSYRSADGSAEQIAEQGMTFERFGARVTDARPIAHDMYAARSADGTVRAIYGVQGSPDTGGGWVVEDVKFCSRL